MATYATGRTRNVVFSGTVAIDGQSSGRYANLSDCSPDIDPFIARHTYGEAQVIYAGTSDGVFTIKPFVELKYGGTDSIGASIFGLNGIMTVGIDIGDPFSYVSTGSYPVVAAPVVIPFDIDATETVSWSLTFPNCEERFEPVDLDPALTDTINGLEWPSYGGTADDDDLPGRKVTFFEFCPAGETVTFTATCAGGTLTVTRLLTVGCVIVYPWQVTAWEEATARETFCGTTVTAEGDITWGLALNGVASVADWGTTTADAQGQFVDWNTLRARATSSPSATGLGRADVDHFLAWPIRYELAAKLFSPSGAAYGGSVDLKVDAIEGGPVDTLTLFAENTRNYDQRYWILTGFTNLASRTTSNVTEWQGVRAWLDSASLSSAGEAAGNWPMMFLGTAWKAADLHHEAETTLTDGSSASGWTGATSSGGVLTIA